MHRRHTIFARGLAGFMAVLATLQFGTVRATPGDIFEVPAPVIGADPPKATEIRDGDASVSTMTGALTYSYPIAVPPGRNGMAPHLALSYSSQAPTYGTFASGWSLSIPMIQEDSSQGRLRTHAPEVEAEQGPGFTGDDDRFSSTLAGGRPLIVVAEPFVQTSGAFSASVYKMSYAPAMCSFSWLRSA